MTHQTPDHTPYNEILEHLTEQGFDGMAGAIQILLNEAMKLERSEFMGAAPHERRVDRQGRANGFKPKRMKTRVGEIELSIPQVRDLPEGVENFYPNALVLRCMPTGKSCCMNSGIEGLAGGRSVPTRARWLERGNGIWAPGLPLGAVPD